MPKPVSTAWTPVLTSRLRLLFAEGLSFSHIASELAMTRDAVIGKSNRLGLVRAPPPKTGWRPRYDPRRNTKLQKILAGPSLVSDSLPPIAASDLEIPKRQRRNIWTLGPRDCRFVVGDPATPDHFFCGARKLPLLPYCADHARRCFHPARGS